MAVASPKHLRLPMAVQVRRIAPQVPLLALAPALPAVAPALAIALPAVALAPATALPAVALALATALPAVALALATALVLAPALEWRHLRSNSLPTPHFTRL